jgi:RHS repeat-associated protein
LLLSVLIAALGCRTTDSIDPRSGAPEHQALNFVRVPGAWVNAVGGNLLVRRVDMTLDTLFGTQEIAASYNSASGEWLWNFEISYDGSVFVDPTGVLHTVDSLADGQAIAGSTWVKVDADTIETKGGFQYHFDASGRIDHIRWATIDYPRIQHSAYQAGGVDFRALEQCTAPGVCTAFFEIELNAVGDPIAVEDQRTGRRVEYEYTAGHLTRVKDPLAIDRGWAGTQYEYSPWLQLLDAIVNSEGERIEYRYQANRRIVDVVQIGEGNPTHHFEFNTPNGHTGFLHSAFHTNPLGGETRYLIDAELRVVEIARTTAGETVQIQWDGLRPSEITAASGATTTFSYTADDLTSIVEPSGNTVAITYELGALNQEDVRSRAIANVQDSLGSIEQRTYGADGRVATTVNGTGDTVTYGWAPITLASLTNALGATFDFPIYGVHGHWLEMSGSGIDRRSVDPTGNVLIASTGRQQGGILTSEYDPNRNVSALTLAATANGSVVSQDAIAMQRRSDGELQYVARPGGGDHQFAYDALGRLASRDEFVDGAWQATTFEYDLSGNTAAVTRPNGMREEYDYDAYARLIAHRALRNGTQEGEETFVYQGGRVVSRFDSIRNATEVYSYDTAGRLALVAFEFGESVSAEYDARSRVVAETLSSPAHGVTRRIEYEYDLANRITRLGADNDELLAAWTYQDGAVAQIQYGNGLTRTFQTDPATGTMVSASTEDDLTAVLETTTVAKTIELNPAREQIRSETATTLANSVERYSLTRGGNLSNPDGYQGQRVFGWDDEAGHTKSFDYDEMSNWVDNAAGDTFAYNTERNRLLSATLVDEGVTLGYAYDEAGFATLRGGDPISWSATGRMASVGADSITWDLRGRPIATSIGGVNAEFVYFGGRVPNDPQSGALQALDLGVARVDFDAVGRTYRHFDFRYNVSFVSDETGSIVSHYQYSPYGVDTVFGYDGDAVRFVGRTQIGDLMWLGARIYDPLVGRFLSPDPVFNLVNQFTYTLGNPIRYWDPDGQESQAQAKARARATLKPGLKVVAAGLALAGILTPCSAACGAVAAAIAVAIAIADLTRGSNAAPPNGPPGTQPGGTIGGLGGGPGTLGSIPSCGLLGIEPFAILAFVRRRRRRRGFSLGRG